MTNSLYCASAFNYSAAPNSRWSYTSNKDNKLSDSFEDTSMYLGAYSTYWSTNDNRELLLLCRDKSFNLEKVATIMRRNKTIIVLNVHQLGIGLLQHLGYFNEPPKATDHDVVKYIIETFDINDAAIEYFRKSTKAQKALVEIFDTFMKVHLTYVSNSNDQENVDLPSSSNELTSQVLNRINSGVATNIVGPLLVDLLTRAIKGDSIKVITEAINRPEVLIRHKLALVATKFIFDLHHDKPIKQPLIKIANPAKFANSLIYQSLFDMTFTYNFTNDILLTVIEQIFDKYITQIELDTAITFISNSNKDKDDKVSFLPDKLVTASAIADTSSVCKCHKTLGKSLLTTEVVSSLSEKESNTPFKLITVKSQHQNRQQLDDCKDSLASDQQLLQEKIAHLLKIEALMKEFGKMC